MSRRAARAPRPTTAPAGSCGSCWSLPALPAACPPASSCTGLREEDFTCPEVAVIEPVPVGGTWQWGAPAREVHGEADLSLPAPCPPLSGSGRGWDHWVPSCVSLPVRAGQGHTILWGWASESWEPQIVQYPWVWTRVDDSLIPQALISLFIVFVRLLSRLNAHYSKDGLREGRVKQCSAC